MIILHLGIGSGDVQGFEFDDDIEFLDFLHQTYISFNNVVWLYCDPYDEIMITEKFDYILTSAKRHSSNSAEWIEKNIEFHLHEYPTYTDAYAVALDMREGNPLQ